MQHPCLTHAACMLAASVSLVWHERVLAAPEPAERTNVLETVYVTARLRQEDAQSIPVSLSVVDGATLDRTFTNNVQQVSQLVPALNYVSPNPRNTAYTIRGLGSSVVAVSQANDGLEPGVGFYVDQVYHARPATAAFDFVDVERMEVLRGPQGTLFGKNTTAGAINISSRSPTFDPALNVEASGGPGRLLAGEGRTERTVDRQCPRRPTLCCHHAPRWRDPQRCDGRRPQRAGHGRRPRPAHLQAQ